MMKLARPYLLGIAAVSAALLALVLLAANGRVQTWAVQRWLRAHPGIPLQVAGIHIGWDRVEVRDVRWQSPTGTLQVPSAAATVRMIPLVLHREFIADHLDASGWTFTVSDTPAGAPVTEPKSPMKSAAPQGTGGGLLQRCELPCATQLKTFNVAGTVRSAGRRFVVSASGGNFVAGGEGSVQFKLDAPASGPDDRTVSVTGTMRLHQSTPRRFDRLALTAVATAQGGVLAEPVTLNLQLSVAVQDAREVYHFSFGSRDRQLAAVDGRLDPATRQLDGNWRLNLSDSDITPFALGHTLPHVRLSGEGDMAAAINTADVHASGSINASLDRLEVLDPRLAGIGPLRVVAALDAARRDTRITIQKLDCTVWRHVAAASGASDRQVAGVRALQAFDFQPSSGEVTPTETSKPLLDVTLAGVPLAWARPFLQGWEVAGDDLVGEIVATPRAGGVTFRTMHPLGMANTTLSRAGAPLFHHLDVTLGIAGDYTPEGWQAEFNGVTARSGASTVFLLDAKAGRLAGVGQPIKSTGLVTLDVAGLLAQPIAHHLALVQKGTANLDFSASLGRESAVRANIALKDIVAGERAAPMPAITATLRADVAADGRITVDVPLRLVRDGRTSDIAVVGTVEAGATGGNFDARVTSANLVLADAQILRMALAGADGAPTEPPAWAGWEGTLAMQLNHVTAPGGFELSDIAGRLHLSGGTVHFEQGKGGSGTGTSTQTEPTAQADKRGRHLTADADIAIGSFDPGPLFVHYDPHYAPTVEGPFELKGTLRSDATRWSDLAAGAYGEVALTSKGGVFRGLNVNVGNLVENSSKLVGWLTAAGQAIASPFSGRKDVDEITSRSQAAQELAKILSNIAYDQLAITIAADAGGPARVEEFTLISPDLRITGHGSARGPRLSFMRQEVTLDLSLRARGRPAELMKYLGVLDAKPDDLGYAGCTIPVRVDGALDRPDTTQLSNRLVALAVAKTGLTEKAVDWINRLRGKSAN